MINITQKDISSMSLFDGIELGKDKNIHILYKPKGYVSWFLDGFSIEKLQEVATKGIPYTVISISEELTKDELKNIPLERVAEVLPELIEPEPQDENPQVKKFKARFETSQEKLSELNNKACYAIMAANMTGSISLLPKSNAALRINFDCKEQAEAYLKQFRRKMHYATNPVDFFTVAEFYSMLGLVLSEKQRELAAMYGWQTVSTPEEMDKWLSRQVNKSSDKEGWYGFTITKRASKISRESDESI